MKEALRAYYEKNKSLPQRIIVYRDGVGDGMLDGVVRMLFLELVLQPAMFHIG